MRLIRGEAKSLKRIRKNNYRDRVASLEKALMGNLSLLEEELRKGQGWGEVNRRFGIVKKQIEKLSRLIKEGNQIY